MLIRVIRNVDGLHVDSAPYHEHPDTARALISAGIAIEVPPDGQIVVRTEGGLTREDVLDQNGQVIRSFRPAPDARWTIIPEKQISGDWVQAPYLFVSCTSCGKREVRQGPKAYEPKFRHCPIVTEPRVGNYVKVTVDACPHAILKEFQRLYRLWAKDHKGESQKFPPEDIYAINWARAVEKLDRIAEKQLERMPRTDLTQEK